MGSGHSTTMLKAGGSLSGMRYLCPWVVVALVMGGGHHEAELKAVDMLR